MIDLSPPHIKRLFEKQIAELTKKTLCQEDFFDFQMSGGWLR